MFAFVQEFFLISSWESVLSLCALVGIFALLFFLGKKEKSFYFRMSVALACGLLLGLCARLVMGADESLSALKDIAHLRWIYELDSYLRFCIGVFMNVLKLLVIPMVFVGIVRALVCVQNHVRIGSLIGHSFFWLLLTTALAAVIGIALGVGTHLGFSSDIAPSKSLGSIKPFTEMLLGLIPSNIITAMNANSIMGVVIFAFLIGLAARSVGRESEEKITTFKSLINACYEIVIKIALCILEAMPYAIVAMVAHTLISSGVGVLLEAAHFLILAFVAMVLVFVLHGLILMLYGLNPLVYFKKALPPLLMAFTSRSSSCTLPLTISTLTQKLGVSSSNASFVASLGTTMGMNGCAGYYAALVAVFMYHTLGLDMGFGDMAMIVILCVITSFGIAGIPGITIMILSVMLTGLGLDSHFALLGVILAIDPIVDMARTCSNVSGAMIASIVSDKALGTLDREAYRA